MSKRVFRLFWSLDIIKIEKWLCEMAAKGYHLKGIETVKRVFVFDKFDKGESRGTTYRICYNKEGVNVVGQALTNNGWYCAFTKKKWSVLANENDETQIKINPSREGLLNRNRIVKYAVAIILGIYLITQMLPIFLLLYIFFFPDVTYGAGGKVSLGLYLLSSLIIISLVTASLAYIIIKLNKADKKLRKENGTDLNLSFTIPKDTILDATTEKKLRKEGKIIKKRKLGWVYAPDRAEEWLEKMETSGYNLYRMSRMGNSFYFIKGEPRTVRYCMDFQNIVNKSYFEIHKSNGWKLLFTSLSSLTKYTVWSKEYSDVRSELYSDKSNILKHAKNQCRLYLILFIPLIILYLLMIGGFIIMYLELKHIVIAIDVAIFSVCIVEYGYFVMTSLSYYLRVKKRIS